MSTEIAARRPVGRQLGVAQSPLARLLDGICERNKVTLTRLARMVFVDHSAISRIRSGQRTPSRELVLLMAANWPMTIAEKIELCTHFQTIPPGFHLVPNGGWAIQARKEIRR